MTYISLLAPVLSIIVLGRFAADTIDLLIDYTHAAETNDLGLTLRLRRWLGVYTAGLAAGAWTFLCVCVIVWHSGM